MIKTSDDNLNSNYTLDASVKTLGCSGGGGGGGGSAHQVGSESAATPSAAQATGSVVIVRTTRTSDGGWCVVAKSQASTAGLGLSDTSGIFIQMPDGAGGYRHPMRLDDADQFGLCALHDGRRVVLAGNYALTAISSTLRAGGIDYALASATRGSSGSLGEAFISSGGTVSLGSDDSLTLVYQPSSSPADTTASWFALVSRSSASISSANHQRPTSNALPTRFSLRQNQPNPFRSATTIRFDLPVGSLVHLDVFDAQGRRVATLANGFYPAGYHAVTWNPSSGVDAQAGPGVYFYRIHAGGYTERRKMVLTSN
jgi:hypothetical protein